MMRTILTLICSIYFMASYAQMSINIGVDTTTIKAKQVIPFLSDYFSDFKKDNEVDYNQYFAKEDVLNNVYPDKVAFGLLGNTTNYVLGNPSLLSLDIKTDTIKAKVLFATVDSLKNLQTNFIANYYINYDGGNCKFLNTQDIETIDWQRKVVRNVTFHYPPHYEFNLKKAQILIDSIISLEKTWKLETINIDYYFANTNQEIQKIKGFDFNFYMARSEYPQGLAYEKEKTVYCSGYGENCFHEVVHLYLNPLYPNSPLKEGIATFYGGSLGKSFLTDLVKLNNFVQKHPEINIANHHEFYYLDEQTVPKYVIQAFICYLVNKKNGINGLKKLLSFNSLDEIYKTEFGVEPIEQNDFLRTEIEKYIANIE